MKLNLKGQKGFSSFSVVPAGVYGLSVSKCELGTSAAGNPKLKLVYQIEEDAAHDGKYVGRRIFNDIPIMDNDASKGRIVDLLHALGFSEEEVDNEAFELDPAELQGLQGVAEIVIRQLPGRDGLDKSEVNDIKRWIFNLQENSSTATNNAAAATNWGEVDDAEYEDDAVPSDETLKDILENGMPNKAEEYKIPDDVRLSQQARKFAMEHEIDFTNITPTGPGNTYTLQDVKSAVVTSDEE